MDQPPSATAGSSVSHPLPARPGTLQSSPLKLTVVGVLGAIIAFAIVDYRPLWRFPPGGMSLPPSPAEQAQAKRFERLNTASAFGLIGAVLALALCVGESLSRRSWKFVAFGAPASMLLGAATGAFGGWAGYCVRHGTVPGTETVKSMLKPEIAEFVNHILQHAVVWGAMGLGIGCGVALPLVSLNPLAKGSVAGALGGIVSAVAYVVCLAIFFPHANPDPLIPHDWIDKLALYCLNGALMGAFLALVLAPSKRAAAVQPTTAPS